VEGGGLRQQAHKRKGGENGLRFHCSGSIMILLGQDHRFIYMYKTPKYFQCSEGILNQLQLARAVSGVRRCVGHRFWVIRT